MSSLLVLNKLISEISSKHLLVIGDLMLDKYFWGTVNRISPEAPVPIVEVTEEETRLGGAANVALNLKELGASVSVCGLVGADSDGGLLRYLLNEREFDVTFVYEDENRRTTSKTRVIGNQQHTVRLDREDRSPLSPQIEEKILTKLLPQLSSFDAIIFEDYNKGMLTPGLIEQVIFAANKIKVPVIVDPKFDNFLAYGGCTLFKPNLKELNQAMGQGVEGSDTVALHESIAGFRKMMPHSQTMVTLGEYGVLGASEKDSFTIPAHLRKIRDVSGAGDTVVAVVALCIACGLDFRTAAELSNIAGGLVCEDVGVVPVNKDRWIAEAKRVLEGK